MQCKDNKDHTGQYEYKTKRKGHYFGTIAREVAVVFSASLSFIWTKERPLNGIKKQT